MKLAKGRGGTRRDPVSAALRANPELLVGPLVVGVSGGLDSTVLAHALSELAPKRPNFSLAHIDHQLRGEESTADRRFVEELGQKLGVSVQVAEVNPESLRQNVSSRSRPSLEEAARGLRREALMKIAEGDGARLVLAHHMNDQAETVLLRLFRGTGSDGTAGMPAVSRDGRILRPLIGVTREELREFAAARGLRWREDSSNGDSRFARNRLRGEWLPGLARAFNPQLLRALAHFAEAQRTDRDFFFRWVDEAYGRIVHREDEDESFVIDPTEFAALHDAVASRLLSRIFDEAGIGREVTRAHLTRARDFIRRPQRNRTIEFPLGWRMRREPEGVHLARAPVFDRGEC